MADIMLGCFKSLNLDRIDQDWLKDVWDSDLTIFENPPELVEDLKSNKFYTAELSALASELNSWIGEDRGFYDTLADGDVSPKTVLALLAYLLDYGAKVNASSSQLTAAIYSANCYLKLLAITGSRAYQVFHSFVIEKIVELLKTQISKTQGVLPDESRSETASQKQKKKKKTASSRRRGGRRAQYDSSESENDTMDVDDYDDVEEEVTGTQKQDITSALLNLLRALVLLLHHYSLKENKPTLSSIVECLKAVTTTDPEKFDSRHFDPNSDMSRVPSFTGLAYYGLYTIACGKFGEDEKIYILVVASLLSNTLMQIGPNNEIAAQHIPRSVQLIKDQAVDFLRYVLEHHHDDVVLVVRRFIMNLCAQVADKADYKLKVAQAIVRIMEKFSKKAYADLILWFKILSRGKEVPRRRFSVELFYQLLQTPTRSDDDTVPEMVKPCLTHSFLLEQLVSRCSDASPSVRSRALALFSECYKIEVEGVRELLNNLASTTQTPNTTTADSQIRISGLLPDTLAATTATETPPLSAPVAKITTNATPDTATPTSTATPTTAVPSTAAPTDMTDGVAAAAAPGECSASTSVASTGAPGELAQSAAVSHRQTSTGTIGGQNRTSAGVAARTIFIASGSNISLHGDTGLLKTLEERACDEKIFVRKAAVSALEAVILNNECAVTQKMLEVLRERCIDIALSVRKQALVSMTEVLLKYPASSVVQKAWLEGVPSLVKDRETTVQEKTLEVLESVILENINKYGRQDDGEDLLWSLMVVVSGNQGSIYRGYLKQAFTVWQKAGKLKPYLVKHLQTHINTPHSQSAWMLLSLMGASVQKMDSDFLYKHMMENMKMLLNKNDSDINVCQNMLHVLSANAKCLKADQQTALSDKLTAILIKFATTPEIIAGIVGTIDAIESELHPTEDPAQASRWCDPVLKQCDRYLSAAILNEQQDSVIEEETLLLYIHTMGCVSQLIPARIPRRVFLLVQSLVAAPQITTIDGSTQKQATEATSDPPTSDIPSSQPPSSQPPSSQPVLSQFSGSKMSTRVRACAFTCLGKLCLQDDNLARRCIPALGKELVTSKESAIRNNIVVILGDLYRLQTTYVERYTNDLTACLKDATPLLRYQALVIITELLQQDFMKWKGPLIFRYLSTILDTQKQISDYSKYHAVHSFLVRKPTMFFQHFVESIFYYNRYTQHAVYNNFSESEAHQKLFSFPGKAQTGLRMKIYCYMLQHLTDEQKFKVTAKLCQDVFGGFTDQVIKLGSDTSFILEDTLEILCSKEIKLTITKAKNPDDMMDEPDIQQALANVARKEVITKVVRKDVIENIVPTVLALKGLLERKRSPLLKNLMRYLRELMKDYKGEIQDILAADRILAKEIEYDMKKFEAEEAAQANKSQNAGNKTPGRTTPAPKHVGTPRVAIAIAQPQMGTPAKTPAKTPVKTPNATEGTRPKTPTALQTPAKTPTGAKTPQQVPRTPHTPRGIHTPQHARTPQHMCTPRTKSLATQALINSARKAMAAASATVNSKGTSARLSRPTSQLSDMPEATSDSSCRASGVSGKAKKVVGWADQDSNHSQPFLIDSRSSLDDNSKADSTRRLASTLRAVSTPHRGIALSNLTFQDVSVIERFSLDTSADATSMDDDDGISALPTEQTTPPALTVAERCKPDGNSEKSAEKENVPADPENWVVQVSLNEDEDAASKEKPAKQQTKARESKRLSNPKKRRGRAKKR